MRYAALIEPTPDGWAGRVPDLPEVLVEATTSLEVERLLPAAIGRALDARRAAGAKRALRAWSISRYVTVHAGARSEKRRADPAPMTEEDVRSRLERVEALLRHRGLPADLLNDLFRYGQDLKALLLREPHAPYQPPGFTAAARMSSREEVIVGEDSLRSELVLEAEGEGPEKHELRLPQPEDDGET